MDQGRQRDLLRHDLYDATELIEGPRTAMNSEWPACGNSIDVHTAAIYIIRCRASMQSPGDPKACCPSTANRTARRARACGGVHLFQNSDSPAAWSEPCPRSRCSAFPVVPTCKWQESF